MKNCAKRAVGTVFILFMLLTQIGVIVRNTH